MLHFPSITQFNPSNTHRIFTKNILKDNISMQRVLHAILCYPLYDIHLSTIQNSSVYYPHHHAYCLLAYLSNRVDASVEPRGRDVVQRLPRVCTQLGTYLAPSRTIFERLYVPSASTRRVSQSIGHKAEPFSLLRIQQQFIMTQVRKAIITQ